MADAPREEGALAPEPEHVEEGDQGKQGLPWEVAPSTEEPTTEDTKITENPLKGKEPQIMI